ncbi:MAG: DNA polymerase III subunit beta [Candidatus Daviesbacteria bacterium]|nr:DNA polymerase III subunit beta [Candidatus Daviesbacteria bacterium]
MRFSVLQSELLPALSSVARSCGVRAQLPVLNNILISASTNTLKLSATNLEVGVVKSLKAEVLEEGEVTLPARTLVDVVSNLSGKIEFVASSDQVEISTPSFSSKITGISASEFPAIPLSGKEAVEIDAQALLKSLPQVSFAAAIDEGRPVLTGILLEIKENQVEFVATDGYRLAHKKLEISQSLPFRALIPRKTFEEVVRLIAEEGSGKVRISTSDNQNQIIFTIDQTQLSSRLIEGQFPAWEKIIPQELKCKVVVDKAEILKAVKLASVFSRSEANVVKLQNSDGKLVLTSEAKELGSQRKEVEAVSVGEELQIAFNTKFLQDALNAIDTPKLSLELSGPLSAAMIKPQKDEGLQYIIMPVNLS